MIRAAALIAALAAGAFTGGAGRPAPLPTCAPGEVTVHGTDWPTCDLDPRVNTLTVLGITEHQCDDIGGAWIYEACVDTDY